MGFTAIGPLSVRSDYWSVVKTWPISCDATVLSAGISVKLGRNISLSGHCMVKRFSRSLGKRCRSGSDGHGNDSSWTAEGIWIETCPNVETKWLGFQGHGFKLQRSSSQKHIAGGGIMIDVHILLISLHEVALIHCGNKKLS